MDLFSSAGASSSEGAPSIELRGYQEEAACAAYEAVSEGHRSVCISLPTGAGKSFLIARIAADAVAEGKRVLILAHRKELLVQNREKLLMAGLPHVGLNSAGLGPRETGADILVAGVQSVWRDVSALGRREVVIIDEAHRIPPEGEGMYRTVLGGLGNPVVYGLTATPFRTGSGELCGEGELLETLCYEGNVAELIEAGWLCPVRSKGGKKELDTSGLHSRMGEFIQAEAEELMLAEEALDGAIEDIVRHTEDRKSVLIFAAGVKHGELLSELLRRRLSGDDLFSHQEEILEVFGHTQKAERDEVIARFAAGEVKYLVNVGVLTEGFDSSRIDCVVLARPTRSPGLYVQMVGRGLRMDEAKADCLVLDFGGNIRRHGPLDAVRAVKAGGDGPPPLRKCQGCQEIVPASCSVCPVCGLVFPKKKREIRHADSASDAVLLSTQAPKAVSYEVAGVHYFIHEKRGDPDAPKTLRVEYEIGWNTYVKEWVCFSHQGFARRKAENWWRVRAKDEGIPGSTEEAFRLATEGVLREPTHIMVRSDGKWDRIEHCEFAREDVPDLSDLETPF